jgi:MFS transporter, OFA family, oxalate/formate antiporter
MTSREKAPEARTGLYYGWVIAFATMIITASLLASRQSYGVFFKSIEGEFNLSRAGTSGIFSVYMALSAVVAVVGGWSLDKYGPKFTMAMYGFFTGTSLILTSQIREVWQFYLVYSLIMALGTGAAFTSANALVSRWFVKKRGLALGIAGSGGGVGPLIIAPLASFLIMTFSWRTTYIVMGIVDLTVIIAVAMLLKRSPAEIGLLPDGARVQPQKDSAPLNNPSEPPSFTIKDAIGTRQFWQLFFIWAFTSLAVYVVNTHIVPHATDLGISAVGAAAVLGVFSGGNVTGGLFSGYMCDKISKKAIIASGGLVGSCMLYWLIFIQNNLGLFITFAAVFGFCWGCISTTTSAIFSDLFGVRNIGKLLGWTGISWFLGATLGPLLGGAVFDKYNSYSPAFFLVATGLLAAVILALTLKKPGKPAA